MYITTLHDTTWFSSSYNKEIVGSILNSTGAPCLNVTQFSDSTTRWGDGPRVGAPAARSKKKEHEEEREARQGKHARYSCVPVGGGSFSVTASLPHSQQS